MATKNLVIVESPAKAKTIKKYLGAGFEVKASMGHIRDLPGKKLWIDIDKNFEPTYEISDTKKKVVSELKKIAKDSDQVWIATDEDREGEAIGWHICHALGLNTTKIPRIVFHEITKTAIQNAIKNPRNIDMHLVDAQQGRRVLDRLVWFQVSPILWTKIKRGISAGRVQSVAVKLIVEREKEIKNFIPEESWKCKALITYKKSSFTIELSKIQGKKAALKTQKAALAYLASIGCVEKKSKQTKDKKSDTLIITFPEELAFTLDKITSKDTKKSPPAPFTTSTLQQLGSRAFGRGVKKIMMVAQKLYENGYITYMRTDSVNLSQDAIDTSAAYITKTFGKDYSSPRQYKGKAKNAQEAHEAIRPTDVTKSPAAIDLSGEEQKLYGLIRNRTLASQMADARGTSTTYDFSPEGAKKDVWSVKGEIIIFDGWLKLTGKIEKQQDDENTDEDNQKLPAIKQGEIVHSKDINATQHFSKPPARYTEAALVKTLEEKGIGRPSTYAPTIQTIQDRQYIEKKEAKKLYPTEMAFIVTDFLEKHFSDLMDYAFTANMEEKLDLIAEWKDNRHTMMKQFYTGFLKELEKAGHAKQEVIYTGNTCPECGGKLIYKFSKTWKFVGCENYPTCKYTSQTEEEKSVLDTLKAKYEGKPCPEGGTIVVKIGRFGPFLTSSEYPKVKRISGIPDEKMEALQKEYGGKKCEKCGKGKMMVKKSNRWGKTTYFLACNKYPDCKHTINIKEEAKEEE